MKLKSLVNSIFMMILLFGGVLFFTGCEKDSKTVVFEDSKISLEIQNDAIQWYGRVITLSDFPKNKVWKQSESSAYKHIGTNKENALVPLVFDENEVLYTAKRYNGAIELSIKNNQDDEIGTSIFFTDLQTFKSVTLLKEATEEYARALSDENGNLRWMFDPYVKFFETADEISRNTDKRLQLFTRNEGDVRSVPSWAKVGNIVFGRWDDNSISDTWGHTGGVVVEPNGSGTNNFLLTLMKTVEASNAGKNIAGITIGTQNGVFERYMSTNSTNVWASSLVYQRTSMWRNNMTTAQRTNVKNYMQQQIGESYNFSSSKTNTSSWYCSKLQWKAYSVHLGIDIDFDGGFTVWPTDIVNSSLLVGMSFGLL